MTYSSIKIDLCSEPGCRQQATHSCVYPGCGRRLCETHSIDLETPIRDHPEASQRINAYRYRGYYCRPHGEEIGKSIQSDLRANTIIGYFVTIIQMIFSFFWELLKFIGRTALDVISKS